MTGTGTRIRELRKARGLTQGQLAIKLGYKNSSAVSRLELEVDRELTAQVAERFAEALDSTPEYIMYGITPNDINNYYESFLDYEKQFSSLDKLRTLLKEDPATASIDYTDEQLQTILQYARFIGQ